MFCEGTFLCVWAPMNTSGACCVEMISRRGFAKSSDLR